MPQLPHTRPAPQWRGSQVQAGSSNIRSPVSAQKCEHLSESASQDHDFLENEQFFLETLKKAPYNMAYHSA